MKDSLFDALSANWYCVGSTEIVDARDNITPGIAWNAEDIPIYNTQGLKVGENIADLFDGSLLNPILYDEDGVEWKETIVVHTGSKPDGTADTWCLGGSDLPFVIQGDCRKTDNDWLSFAWTGTTMSGRLYGISSPVPEPSTLLLLGLGVVMVRKRK